MSWSENISCGRRPRAVLPLPSRRQAELEAWCEAAYRRGFAAAQEQVAASYNAQILELRRESVEMRDGALATLEGAVERFLATTAAELPGLALQMARQALGGHVAAPEELAARVEGAIPPFFHREAAITVGLNPQDLEHFLEEDRAVVHQGRRLRLEADASLRPGDFRITSPLGELDGRLEKRLDALAEYLGEEEQP